MKSNDKKDSLARKYRDRLAECPVNPEKHPQILGEMMLEMSYWIRYRASNQMVIGFPDMSRLEILFNDDGTLARQNLKDAWLDIVKEW